LGKRQRKKRGPKPPFSFILIATGGVLCPSSLTTNAREREVERERGVAGQAATKAAPATCDTTTQREREFERKSEGGKKGSTNHALLPATVANADDDPTAVEPSWLLETNLLRG